MSILVAARTLGEESSWKLTPLEYQKILYVAQMIHLGQHGAPLVSVDFEAWELGPVVPSLYRALKPFRRGLVTTIAAPAIFAYGTTEAFAIDDAYSMTQHMSAGQLITFLHRPGGAWERSYRHGERSCVIPSSDILLEWKHSIQPSDAALAWAEQMASDVEATPATYLDGENERAFRSRLRIDD